jgi:hypothetical protein
MQVYRVLARNGDEKCFSLFIRRENIFLRFIFSWGKKFSYTHPLINEFSTEDQGPRCHL